MSTYTDAIDSYFALPTRDQAFWNSFYTQYRMWIGTDFIGLKDVKAPDILYYSYSRNLDVGLQLDQPYWVPYGEVAGVVYTPYPWSVQGIAYPVDDPMATQWSLPDFPAYGYPRPKYNVRRSYWTGAPRHRRNR
jgi:hypothetical protein